MKPARARDAADRIVQDNTNPHFAPSLLGTLGRGCPVLLFLSEAERLYYEFQEKFLARHGEAFADHAALADVLIIKAANHVLTYREMQEELKRHMLDWINRRFPSTG